MAKTVGDVIDVLMRHAWRLSPGSSQYDTTNDVWRLYKNGKPPIFIQGTRNRRLHPDVVLKLFVEGDVIQGP